MDKQDGLESAMKNIDISESNSNSPTKLSPTLSASTNATWIDRIKKARKASIRKTDSSESQPCQSKTPTVKTYRRSSISALIATPILKRSDKKKHAVLQKALSASSTSLSSMPAFSFGRVYLRIYYDSITHVLSVTIIQSNKLQHSERQKLYPRVQFHLSLKNGDFKSNVYKTNSHHNLDLIDIKESFYYPNIDQENVNNHTVELSVTGKDRLFFGTDKILSQGSLLLDNLNCGEQLYCSILMEECLNEVNEAKNEPKKDQVFPCAVALDANSNKFQIGLKYDALLGNLTVKVLKASNLHDYFTGDKLPTTFIKLTLTNDETLKKTEVEYQSSVVKSCPNPVYNETFEFSIPSYELENYSLFIKVYAKRILSRANLIGCIVFDNQAKHNHFVEHLYEAISSDGQLIIKWHSLI